MRIMNETDKFQVST